MLPAITLPVALSVVDAVTAPTTEIPPDHTLAICTLLITMLTLALTAAMATEVLALKILLVVVEIPVSAAPLPTKYVPVTLPVALKLAKIKSVYWKLGSVVSTVVVGSVNKFVNNLYLASVMSRK